MPRRPKNRAPKHSIAFLKLRHAFADFDDDPRSIASKDDGPGCYEYAGALHESFAGVYISYVMGEDRGGRTRG